MAGEMGPTLGSDVCAQPDTPAAESGWSRRVGTVALILAGLGWTPGRPALDPQAPRYHPLLLDCARYQVGVRSEILVRAGRQRTRETSGREGVMVIRAVPADTLIRLEAWFDTLTLWREGSGERLTPDTDGLVGGRYRGTLTPQGGFATSDTPFIPDEVAEVADLTGALADLLPPLPPEPLAPGGSWRDDLGMVITRLPNSRLDGRPVERYRLLRRGTRQESRRLTDSTEVTANRAETESGVFSWSGELGVVRWERDLTDEVTVPAGGLVKQPFSTRIGQQVTVARMSGAGVCSEK